MKRLITPSNELPAGYLTTTKFNAPFIKTDGQRNACRVSGSRGSSRIHEPRR